MTRKNQTQAQVLEEAPVEIPQEVSTEASPELMLLQGFRDLVGERYGYFLGRKVQTKKMNNATAEERKAVSDSKKAVNDVLTTIGESTPQWIQDANTEEYQAQQKALTDANKAVKKADGKRKVAQAPFRKDIKPLTDAVKYMDNTAIPDALKELGCNVQPRFSLSTYITEALDAK